MLKRVALLIAQNLASDAPDRRADAYLFDVQRKVLAAAFGPAGLSPQIVGVLNTEINKTLTSAEMKKFLEGEGAEAASMTPQEFGDLIRSETQRWIKVGREANIRID